MAINTISSTFHQAGQFPHCPQVIKVESHPQILKLGREAGPQGSDEQIQ